MAGDGNVWSSLEVAKLVVAALIPITVAALTLVVTRVATDREARAKDAEDRAARRADTAEWANRRSVELLITVHEQMAPLLNDLYCFMLRAGHFREITPPAALATKRACDRTFFVHEHLFDEEFRASYHAFIEACFLHWGPAGEDARLRTSPRGLQRQRGASADWRPDWDDMFVPDAATEDAHQQEQEQAYRGLMESFARHLGLGARLREGESVDPARIRRVDG